MENNFRKIKGFFTFERWKNDSRIVTFAVCLLIATSLWLLNALSKNYTTTLTYPVTYTNPPQNAYLSNTPPDKFDLLVEAHGFTLLHRKLTLSFLSLKIDLSEFSQGQNQIRMEIPTERLIHQIGMQIDNDISIINVSPKIIKLDFDQLIHKSVPVKPRVTLNLKPQHFLSGPIVSSPATIELSGPSGVLDTLREVNTELLVLDGPDTPVKELTSIVLPLNTKGSVEKVQLLIPVEKFTEKTMALPVGIKNKPKEEVIKLFPPQVNVTFMVGLSHYQEITINDFEAVVDYQEIIKRQAALSVMIEKQPDFIQSLKVNPATIEYLIESE